MKGDFELSKLASFVIVLLVVLLLIALAMKITTVRDTFLRLFGP